MHIDYLYIPTDEQKNVIHADYIIEILLIFIAFILSAAKNRSSDMDFQTAEKQKRNTISRG